MNVRGLLDDLSPIIIPVVLALALAGGAVLVSRCAAASEAPAPKVARAIVYRATDVAGRSVARVFPGVRCPVASGWLVRLYNAERIVDGRKLRACYFATEEGIVIVDESHSVTEIPVRAFEIEGAD